MRETILRVIAQRLVALARKAAAICGVLISFSATPALADLSGVWRIKIVNGPSQGDHGVIELTRVSVAAGSARYTGEMRFTDIRHEVTADESCVVTEAPRAVTIRCETDEPGWLPDDFDLTKMGPNEMRGPHSSAVSGEALFLRRFSDQPVS